MRAALRGAVGRLAAVAARPAARRGLALALLAAVAWASLTPRPPSLRGLPSGSDLLAHLLLHLALALSALRAWERPVALRLALVAAVALELAQLRIVGRTFSWADMAANLVGVALAAVAMRRLRRAAV